MDNAPEQLDESIAEGWVNLSYARSMNEQYPHINPRSPGRPYFSDSDGAVPGQWIRVVLRPRGDERAGDDSLFWCVADVDVVLDRDHVSFVRLEVERGAAPPSGFTSRAWVGTLRRDGEVWVVSALGRPDPSRATTTGATTPAVTRRRRQRRTT